MKEETKKQLFVNIIIDLSGGEKITIPNVEKERTQPFTQWIKGHAAPIFDVVLEDEVYFINREFVTAMKFEIVK